MLRSLLGAVGRVLQPFRPGAKAFATNKPGFADTPATIEVSSPAFANDGPIPQKYTVDGPGVFPPLQWRNLPSETRSLALLVEDADSPSARLMVHAILVSIPPEIGGLPEGALPARLRASRPDGSKPGRNSAGRPGWMPPAPPPQHGPHRYAFQVFALDDAPEFDWAPGRSYMMKRIRPHVIAHGTLIGTYQRT